MSLMRTSVMTTAELLLPVVTTARRLQRSHNLATARTPRRRRRQEKRNVATELRSQEGQVSPVQPRIPEPVKPDERGCRVRRAAGQTGRHRNSFREPYCGAALDLH